MQADPSRIGRKLSGNAIELDEIKRIGVENSDIENTNTVTENVSLQSGCGF